MREIGAVVFSDIATAFNAHTDWLILAGSLALLSLS